MATANQLNYIRSLATSLGLPADEAVAKAEALDTKGASALIDRMKSIEIPKTVVYSRTDEIDGLRNVAHLLDARGRECAQSLISQWERKGNLSDNQWRFVGSLTAQATVEKSTPVEPGLYILPDGQVVRVYVNRNLRLSAQVLEVIGEGHGSFRWDRGALDRVRAEGKVLTQEQATAFGKGHNFCCACTLPLSDKRSQAVGYGPTCAKHYGWFYPTAKQAEEMLNNLIETV